MGTAQPGEDPKSMTNSIQPETEERSEARRRLHLKDITNELSGVGSDTAGSDLRAARERRGEDLRAIALSLRIRREQLEALEESRYDDLPGRAYAVGFARSYAEYLGLDSRDIVERYKAELDSRFAAAQELAFPEAQESARMPRGTFLIVALIIGVGIYGGYLMTRSADRMMAERVPAVPSQMAVNGANPNSPEERPASLSGDPASAATRPSSDATAAQLLGDGAPSEVDPSSVYAVPPVVAETPAETATEVASLTPTTAASPADASLSASLGATPAANAAAPAVIPGLPEIAQGQVYGAENTDSRVMIRARKNDAWVRVEDAQGHVLIERTLAMGDVYNVPNVPGAILVARDASAFEIVVDHASLGLAGPPTLVLTGKPLEPAALIAAMPRVTPTPAEEAAAAASTVAR